MRLKPGWYLLFLTLLYALVVTYAWQRSEHRLARLAGSEGVVAEPAAPPPPPPAARTLPGYVLPLPGACLPEDPALLPGGPRPYRKGVSYGFVFAGEGVCVPVVYGEGVVAANDGEVVKADLNYQPLSKAAFDALLEAVKNGASPEQMDRLRGREVWIRHPDGWTSVYAHLAAIAPGVKPGARVRRGDWIGYLGNSGTSYEVEGSKGGPRLLFELWQGGVGEGRYFGQGLKPEAVREKARNFFERLP